VANDPNEVAVALFNVVISEIKSEAILIKKFDEENGGDVYRDGTKTFLTLTLKLKSKLEEQVKTLKILTTFDLDQEEMRSKFATIRILEKAVNRLEGISGEALENLLSFWNKNSVDIEGTIESAKRI
jgi:restriction endonuclease S subunit